MKAKKEPGVGLWSGVCMFIQLLVYSDKVTTHSDFCSGTNLWYLKELFITITPEILQDGYVSLVQ